MDKIILKVNGSDLKTLNSKAEKRIQKIIEILTFVNDTINLKLREENNFTGKIEFTVNCKDGGIGNVEAFSRNKINNST